MKTTMKVRHSPVSLDAMHYPLVDLDLLNQAGSMVTGDKKPIGSGHLPLPSGKINIQRVTNANIVEPSKNSISGIVMYSLLSLLSFF